MMIMAYLSSMCVYTAEKFVFVFVLNKKKRTSRS